MTKFFLKKKIDIGLGSFRFHLLSLKCVTIFYLKVYRVFLCADFFPFTIFCMFSCVIKRASFVSAVYLRLRYCTSTFKIKVVIPNKKKNRVNEK